MQNLFLWTAILTGPCYLTLALILYFARRFFPDQRILFELTEPMLMFGAATVALALAGIIVQFEALR
ncbi:MAG: hypothetical protein M1282_06540 [Chloroflexi bacterium]|nr:hypothetical protein [Chloroflexota bacterium]